MAVPAHSQAYSLRGVKWHTYIVTFVRKVWRIFRLLLGYYVPSQVNIPPTSFALSSLSTPLLPHNSPTKPISYNAGYIASVTNSEKMRPCKVRQMGRLLGWEGNRTGKAETTLKRRRYTHESKQDVPTAVTLRGSLGSNNTFERIYTVTLALGVSKLMSGRHHTYRLTICMLFFSVAHEPSPTLTN